jgi:hypothetical protein
MVAQHYPLKTLVTWSPTGDALVPWKAQVDGQTWSVRLNDFPEEHLYTLLIGGKEMESFDTWPPLWRKLKSTGKATALSPKSAGAMHPYTLLIGEEETEGFDTWPPLWRKLKSPGKAAVHSPKEIGALVGALEIALAGGEPMRELLKRVEAFIVISVWEREGHKIDRVKNRLRMTEHKIRAILREHGILSAGANASKGRARFT